MNRTLRAALTGCAALALNAALSPHVQAAPDPWPQAHSDIRPDPAARFGALANGMRYVILHNATPPHETSIRLRIGSGSFEEADDQQGLAHFLEHMAFKGSAHMPEGEMMKVLQRHGLAFGADTNAFTNFDQTVYQLDLPESDDDSIDLALGLMRETGSELTLDAQAMEPERGVVLSEERLRDTPGYEAARKQQAFVMQGQLPPTRWPIGKVAVIQHAPAARLRDFYRANYRPERAVLVVVGDIDVDRMEVRIKARFGDWRGTGPATGEPVYGPVAKRGEAAQVIVQPGLPLSLSVSWAGPHDPTPDSRAKEGRDLVESLGLNIVNRRLERLARGENPPFLSAGVGRADQLKTIRIAALAVTPRGDDWQGALAAAEGVRRQVLQYGVQPAELTRAVTEARERLVGTLAGAPTRRTPVLAQQILADIDADEVFNTPADNLSIFDAAVKDLKPAQVDAALRQTFTGAGPLLSMVAPTPLKGGEAALTAGFDAAEAAPLKPYAAAEAKPWPYVRFGEPGTVVETRAIPDLGVTFVRFANGARLIFKPTGFRKDQVSIAYTLPGGLLALPSDRHTPLWGLSALGQGGLGRMTLEEVEQALAGKVYGFNARTGEDATVFSGQTRRVDLDTEMQVLTAFLTDPAWRPSGFERIRSLTNLQLDQLDSTPQGVLARSLESLLHSGDARWSNPTHAEVNAARIGEVRGVWDPALAHDPVEITMVGDLTLDQAIAAVGRTVGALPPRGPAVPRAPHGREVHFPAPTPEPLRLTHKGRADQAIAYIAWPATDYYANPQESRALSLAVTVMQDRLLQKVRIAEGATYSPTAALRDSETFPGYGVISASVETPPGKLDGFYRDVSQIIADMRAHPVTADELERARKPRLEQIQKGQQTNEYWMARLPGSEEEPRRLDVIRTSLPGYTAVTLADVQAAARKYLRDETAYKIVVTPEGAAP